MSKIKRSYYLPVKLIDTFDRECDKSGYVRERVVAAAIFNFINASANERQEMFETLDSFNRKKGK